MLDQEEKNDAKTRGDDKDCLTLILCVLEAGRAMTASMLFTILNKGELEHMCLISSPWRLASHFPHSWSQITLVTRG